MKAFNVVVKVLVALAAVAGAVYVIATYGEKIVAWAKDLLARFGCCDCDCCCDCSRIVIDRAPDHAPFPLAIPADLSMNCRKCN